MPCQVYAIKAASSCLLALKIADFQRNDANFEIIQYIKFHAFQFGHKSYTVLKQLAFLLIVFNEVYV